MVWPHILLIFPTNGTEMILKNSWYSLRAYHMLGMVLSALCISSHLILQGYPKHTAEETAV